MNGLQNEFADRLEVVRLNFDDRRNDEAIAALGIRGHPTIVLFNRDGERGRTWFGAVTADDLRPLLEALLAE